MGVEATVSQPFQRETLITVPPCQRANHLTDPMPPTELTSTQRGTASPAELTNPRARIASATEATNEGAMIVSATKPTNQRAVATAPSELVGIRTDLEQEKSRDPGITAAIQFTDANTLLAAPFELTNRVVATVEPEDSTPKDSTPNARRESDPLTKETRLIRLAHQAILRGNPTAALAHLAEHQRSFAHGALQKERDAATIVALCRLSRVHEALALWTRFSTTWPDSALGARVRSSCHWDVGP